MSLTALVIVLGFAAYAVYVAATPPTRRPPVEASAAGLSADVWVMPAGDVAGFLRTHGVHGRRILERGATVVGRVAWTARAATRDERFEVVLGDANGYAGVIDAAYGPRPERVALGSSSTLDPVLRRYPWLAGDAAIHVDEGWTTYGQYASVPSNWPADMWFVGHVVDVRATDSGTFPARVTDPHPVVAVALRTSDRVWWIQRVAG